jgi:AcrR family transcriptional regulator
MIADPGAGVERYGGWSMALSGDERGSYRRAPRQERSRSTVDAIFEAASRLLDDSGVEGATTGRIAHVAGVSIGSLYQYFPRKEALFGALTQRTMEVDLERVREAVDRCRGVPLEEAVREVMGAALAFALERPRLFCWMLRYLPGLGLGPAVEQLERGLIVEVQRLMEDHRSELAAADTALLAVASVGAIRGAVVTLARERPAFLEDRERVLDLAADLALGSLRAHQQRLSRT